MRVFTIMAFMLLAQTLFAQKGPVQFAVESSVDTSNQQIASVVRVWEQYLNSNPDSTRTNPYWSGREQRQYHPYDLVGHTWWSPSLYDLVERWKAKVLSVSVMDSTSLIRTMFYGASKQDSCGFIVRCIITVGARREEGAYRLCNALPINTNGWHREHVGNITFVFPAEHRFNRALAVRMNHRVDSLARCWHLPPTPVEYYFADDFDRVCKALGFDYYPAEGNRGGPRGFVDLRNRIIYSGGSNEWYPHEFVHIYVNPVCPRAHRYFQEGYATLVGGSNGHDLGWHIRRNYEYLKEHPDVDALTFRGVDMFVGPAYVVGGLLCELAEEKGGLPLVRKLMTYGPGDEDLYRAMQDVFGVNRQDINSFLRKEMASRVNHSAGER